MRTEAKKPRSKEVEAALSWLDRKSTKKGRDNLARFGITASKAYGVSVANIQKLAKELGRDHDLAVALWNTGWYEARMLSSFVDEPLRPRRWTDGAATSTTGASATPSVFTSLIARRTPGPRSLNGAAGVRNSSSARPSR
jgi:hypothetical protein